MVNYTYNMYQNILQSIQYHPSWTQQSGKVLASKCQDKAIINWKAGERGLLVCLSWLGIQKGVAVVIDNLM